ncbi:uncharacterized protein [Miscanthus floridulus]|uniref:uncharacterized protein n=1 Tax=Miscanthus floridulus TaxID=154761 RepID=UPI0034590D9F
MDILFSHQGPPPTTAGATAAGSYQALNLCPNCRSAYFFRPHVLALFLSATPPAAPPSSTSSPAPSPPPAPAPAQPRRPLSGSTLSPSASQDYNAGMTYYGDKAKPRAYAARFASPDRDELISVVIKPSNQLKITFLEAKDITDLGTLKEASKIFVPGGAKVFSARTIKVNEEVDIRTYYFYEFRLDKQHVALMATVNSGKTYIAGATAPEMKWGDDGMKLRSAAVSLSVS